MVIDHVGVSLLPVSTPEEYRVYLAFRIIGRIAFPVYAFLLAEGAVRSSDVLNYLLRLLGFALISEIPYDLALHGTLLELSNQNILFTLSASLIAVTAYRHASRKWPGDARQLLGLLVLAAMMAAAEFLGFDYGAMGVLLTFGFYIWRYAFGGSLFQLFGMGLVFAYLWANTIEIYALVAFLPIFLYNGEKGSKLNRYWFYGFYPAHLLALFLIGLMLRQNAGLI